MTWFFLQKRNIIRKQAQLSFKQLRNKKQVNNYIQRLKISLNYILVPVSSSTGKNRSRTYQNIHWAGTLVLTTFTASAQNSTATHSRTSRRTARQLGKQGSKITTPKIATGKGTSQQNREAQVSAFAGKINNLSKNNLSN